MYKIIDNFIEDPEVERHIHDTIMGNYFPWYYNNYVIQEGEDGNNYQLTHVFYRDNSWTTDSSILQPIIDKLNPFTLLRVKANLIPREDKIIEHGMHVDLETDLPITTCVYYLNTNNGYTILEDGTKIESIRNRMLLFDGNIRHSGSSATDDRRVVININFL